MGFRVIANLRHTKVQTLTWVDLAARVGSDAILGPKSSMGHISIVGPTIRIFDAATITTRSELGASALTFYLIEARRLPQSGMGCKYEGLLLGAGTGAVWGQGCGMSNGLVREAAHRADSGWAVGGMHEPLNGD